MQVRSSSPVAFLLTALCAVQATAAASPAPQDIHLDARQNVAPTNNISCTQYATLANLSTIATNSTFRAAFIQASPQGTLTSSGILDQAAAQYAALGLINDTGLNQECGNLSAIAIAAAPKNFSNGIIGPFHVGEGAQLGGGAGWTALMTATVAGAAMLLL